LAPPVTLLAIAAGLAAGLYGLADGLADHLSTLGWLMLGFLVPALYLAGILAVTATAARTLARPALVRLPAALITMHLSCGLCFPSPAPAPPPGLPRAPLPPRRAGLRGGRGAGARGAAPRGAFGRPGGLCRAGAPRRFAGHRQAEWLTSQSTARAAAWP